MDALTSITIPNSVTSIGNYAFAWCSALTIVTIERKDTPITTLGINAFYETPVLSGDNNSKVIYPVGIEYYLEPNWAKLQAKWEDAEGGTPTFNETWRYANVEGGIELTLYTGTDTEIIIPEKVDGKNVVKIGDLLFGQDNTTITSVDMSKATKLKTIGYGAFSGCSSLTSITIPNSVTSIGNSAFNNCSSLTNITIPNGVTSIGNYAFNNCSSLTNITIPNGVTSIGEGAFNSCSALTSITIPNSVTSIGEEAFSRCSSLNNITIPNSVTSIGEEAFSRCSSLTNITIPNSVTSIGISAFNNCNIESINGSPHNGLFYSDGLNGTKDTIVSYGGKSNEIDFIPNSVTSIGYSAFFSCSA